MKHSTPIHVPVRGVALLVAILFASVTLSIGITLANLGSQELSLSFAVRQSQNAFASANSALECVLYLDQKDAVFEEGNDPGAVLCAQTYAYLYPPSPYGDGFRYDTSEWFSVVGGGCAQFSIIKTSSETVIRTRGVNTCDLSSPLRVVERGISLSY